MLISNMYEWAHTVSVYGYKGVSASSLLQKRDVQIALEYDDEVYSTCRVLADKANQEK